MSVEAALNLLWFLIALGCVLVWRGRWSREAGNSCTRRQRGWIALGTALFVLFPVISLSDDLQPQVMVIEDYASSKRSFTSLVSARAPAPPARVPVVSAPAALDPPVFLFSFIFLFAVALLEAPFRNQIFIFAVASRSPPGFFV